MGAVGFTLWQINKTDETVSDSEANTSQGSTLLPNEDDSDEATDENIESTEESSESDEFVIPDDWVQYASTDMGLTFHHPADWTVEVNQEVAPETELVLTPSEDPNVEIKILDVILGFGGPVELNEVTYAGIDWRCYFLSEGNRPCHRVDADEGNQVSEVWIVDNSDSTKVDDIEIVVRQIMQTFVEN